MLILDWLGHLAFLSGHLPMRFVCYLKYASNYPCIWSKFEKMCLCTIKWNVVMLHAQLQNLKPQTWLKFLLPCNAKAIRLIFKTRFGSFYLSYRTKIINISDFYFFASSLCPLYRMQNWAQCYTGIVVVDLTWWEYDLILVCLSSDILSYQGYAFFGLAYFFGGKPLCG